MSVSPCSVSTMTTPLASIARTTALSASYLASYAEDSVNDYRLAREITELLTERYGIHWNQAVDLVAGTTDYWELKQMVDHLDQLQ